MPGQGVELLNPGLDVMTSNRLPLGDRVKVNVVENRLVVGQHLFGIVATKAHTEIGLSFHDGQPESALGTDFVFRRPDGTHGRGGITGGKDIGYAHEDSPSVRLVEFSDCGAHPSTISSTASSSAAWRAMSVRWNPSLTSNWSILR